MEDSEIDAKVVGKVVKQITQGMDGGRVIIFEDDSQLHFTLKDNYDSYTENWAELHSEYLSPIDVANTRYLNKIRKENLP